MVAGFSTSNLLRKEHCGEVTALVRVYSLNEMSVTYDTYEEANKLIQVHFNDILNRTDLLLWLGDKCRSRTLTLEWILQQAEKVCPRPHQIRSLIEPSGVVCQQDGKVTLLTNKFLESFVRVNKSNECAASMTTIQSQCEFDGLLKRVIPLNFNQTLDSQIDYQTRMNVAAIRCALPQLERLSPGCGSVRDLQRYHLVLKLTQKQPLQLRGEVDFEKFSDVFT
ncbi:uncharacterized protein LOC132563099 [Ylistrum balloti]|uniref:uncharacterized protein LOC132563099 n=1 Tax=Ylistrum balloti TaxID=509963 RepID=UPI002905B4BD|nr:uncharacterized protein LOC132563099 [Ylistrum balloti]